MGFGVPLATWFRGDLRGYIADMLAPGTRLHDYLPLAAVKRQVDEHAASRADHGMKLWIWILLTAGGVATRPRRADLEGGP